MIVSDNTWNKDEDIKNETKILRMLDSEFILKLYDYIKIDNNHFIIAEYC